ncbi:MAG: type II toxin-antitoxin system RelE/ParE family toxin [Asticcacaulis sp.]|uniref:type II toxin-antitoxin system RelE/ParE family toxin n=1 Tax=Asticcacaulis sp. TaxID=1872648 RepID=UPI003F7C2F2E
MKLDWSRLALADRESIFDYIEAESPRSAVKVDESIEAAADQLLAHPEIGRPGRLADTREWIVSGLPYIIAYQVSSEAVRVLHNARQWPEDSPL